MSHGNVCPAWYLCAFLYAVYLSQNLSTVCAFLQNLFQLILWIVSLFLCFWFFFCFSFHLSRRSQCLCDVSSYCAYWILPRCQMNCPFFVSSSSCVFCDHFVRRFLHVQVCRVFCRKKKTDQSSSAFEQLAGKEHTFGKDHKDDFQSLLCSLSILMFINILRRNPIEDGAISGFSGQKSVPE